MGYKGGHDETKFPSNENNPLPWEKFRAANKRCVESLEIPNPYFDILNHRTNPHIKWKVINTVNFVFCVHFMPKIVSRRSILNFLYP